MEAVHQVPSFLEDPLGVHLACLDDTVVAFLLSMACLDPHKDSWVFLRVQMDRGYCRVVRLTILGVLVLLVAFLGEPLEVPKIGYHLRDTLHFVMGICFASCQ